jgi:hypothetical protein
MAQDMSLQTEFEFELPMGYVDKEGNLHKKGTMRLATAIDEITILNDMRVQSNEAYIVIVLLARVITSLGRCGQSTPMSSKTCLPQTCHFCRSSTARSTRTVRPGVNMPARTAANPSRWI